MASWLVGALYAACAFLGVQRYLAARAEVDHALQPQVTHVPAWPLEGPELETLAETGGWISLSAGCDDCGYTWVSVAPCSAGIGSLECPHCGARRSRMAA